MKYSRHTLARHIIALEIAGIIFMIVFVWTMEYWDNSGLLARLPSDFLGEFREPAIESIAGITVFTFVVFLTYKLLKRLKYLEGLLHICSFCKKIKVGDTWVPLEEYVSTRTEAVFSHGFCPECGEKHYSEYLNLNKQLTE